MMAVDQREGRELERFGDGLIGLEGMRWVIATICDKALPGRSSCGFVFVLDSSLRRGLMK